MFIGGAISNEFKVSRELFIDCLKLPFSTSSDKENPPIQTVTIKGVVIDQRLDGLINISALFKASRNKTYKVWKKVLGTEEFLGAWTKGLNCPLDKLLKVKRGLGNSYAHPFLN